MAVSVASSAVLLEIFPVHFDTEWLAFQSSDRLNARGIANRVSLNPLQTLYYHIHSICMYIFM